MWLKETDNNAGGKETDMVRKKKTDITVREKETANGVMVKKTYVRVKKTMVSG